MKMTMVTAKCKNVDRLWTFLCEPMFGPNIRFWVDFASSRLENTSFGLEPSGTLTVGRCYSVGDLRRD